jgi:pentose-5-phosphate-3-epimerase
LILRARDLIDKKNPRCEMAIDGGLRHDNMDPLIKCNPDVVVLSSAIFRDPDGITAGVAKCRAALDASAQKYRL